MPDPIAGMPRISPSNLKVQLWAGTPYPGSRMTAEQLAVVERAHVARTFVVRLMTAPRDPREVQTMVEFLCPLLSTTATGRLVITPSGHKKWIDRKGMNE